MAYNYYAEIERVCDVIEADGEPISADLIRQALTAHFSSTEILAAVRDELRSVLDSESNRLTRSTRWRARVLVWRINLWFARVYPLG